MEYKIHLLFLSILFSGLFSFLLAACSQTPESPPESSEYDEEYIGILVDIHLIEAAIQRVRPAERDSIARYYYEQTARAHGMNVEELMEVVRTVGERPAKLEELYELVLDSINRLEIKLTRQKN